MEHLNNVFINVDDYVRNIFIYVHYIFIFCKALFDVM